jgi:hypothetical protein
MFSANLIAQSAADVWHIEINPESDRLLVDVPMVLGAMIGIGDHTLALLMWGFLVVPPAFLWLVSWIVGRTVIWVAKGFRLPR